MTSLSLALACATVQVSVPTDSTFMTITPKDYGHNSHLRHEGNFSRTIHFQLKNGDVQSIIRARNFACTSAKTWASTLPLRAALRARQSRLLTWSARTALGGSWLTITSNR